MKKNILLFSLVISFISYGEIKIKVRPLTFKEVRAQNNGIYRSKAKARGVIIVESDNLEADKGKLVKFEVPEYVHLTNGKRWIKTKKIVFKDKDQEIIIDEENEKVIYHVILDKKELADENDKDKIDGIYKGELNLNYSIYGKEM